MSRRTSTIKACESLRDTANFKLEMLSTNISKREIQANDGLNLLSKRLDDCTVFCDNLLHTLVDEGRCHSDEMTQFLQLADALIARIAIKVNDGLKQQKGRKEVINVEENEVEIDEGIAICWNDEPSRVLLDELRITVKRMKSPTGPLVQKQWDDIETRLDLVVTTVQGR